MVVAHKILVTSPEAKFLFSLLGLFGALGFGLGLGLGLVKRKETAQQFLRLDSPDDDRQVFRFLVMSEE